MARLESDSGRNDEAVAHQQRAIALLEPVVQRPDAPTAPASTWPSPTITSPYPGPTGWGSLRDGERHLRRAIELRDALAAEYPDDPAHGIELSRSLSNLGELQNRAGKTAQALESVRRALALQQDLVRRWHDDAQLRHQLSLTTRGLAHILNTLGQRDESERRMRESVAIIERVVAENPAVVEHRRVLGTIICRARSCS